MKMVSLKFRRNRTGLVIGIFLVSFLPVIAQPTFKFQSNFWINLHLYLQAEAWYQNHNGPLRLYTHKPNGSESEIWKRCVSSYSELATKKLVFDPQLIKISNILALQNGDVLSSEVGIDEAIEKALNKAAPIYRKYIWKEQSKINEDWIKRMAPLINRYANDMLKKLPVAYQTTWFTGQLIVDLSGDVGPNLAFTTKGPPGTTGHTIIAPAKTADSLVAFETVFHEASHTVDTQIINHINDAAANEGVTVLDDLWHGMIFFTVGEMTKKELNITEPSRFKPYYITSGIDVSNNDWRQIFAALKEAWLPYLNHQDTFDEAISQLVVKASTNSQK